MKEIKQLVKNMNKLLINHMKNQKKKSILLQKNLKK